MKITHYIGRRRISPLATVPSHLTPVRSSVWMLRAMLPVIIALFSWTWIQHRLWAGNYMTWLAGCGLGFCLAWFYEPVAAILLPAQCPKGLGRAFRSLFTAHILRGIAGILLGAHWDFLFSDILRLYHHGGGSGFSKFSGRLWRDALGDVFSDVFICAGHLCGWRRYFTLPPARGWTAGRIRAWLCILAG